MTTETNKFKFITSVNLATPVDVKVQLQKAVNRAYIGDVPVNIYDDTGRLVANPDVVITEEHKEAAWHINASHRFDVEVTVDLLTGHFSYEAKS